MNNKILVGAAVLACICIIISIAYACVYLDIEAEYEEYVGIGDAVYIYAWVNVGGPVYEWCWTWPSQFNNVHYSHYDYDSNWEGTCDTAGKYTIEVDADSQYGWDYDSTDVYVVDVNVYPFYSYFVGLNDDDDNNNGYPDKDESGPVLGENDLVQVGISLEPSELNTGKVILEASSNIKVWYDSEKEYEVSLPATWYVYRDEVPSSVWVEGVNASSSIADTSLTISYKTYWSPILDDNTVLYTVLNVQITQPTGSNSDHQLAFDSDNPGVCEFQVTGTTGFTAFDSDLKWTLEEIADPYTTLTAVPDPCVGTSVTFTYTGLPSSNSEFGKKKLTLTHVPTGFQDSIDLEIFFDPNTSNNPGNNPENQDGVSVYPVPNWFYYWKEGGAVPDLVQDANGFYYGGPSDDRSGEYRSLSDTLWLFSLAYIEPGDYDDDVNTPLYNHRYRTKINTGELGNANTNEDHISDDDTKILYYFDKPDHPNTKIIRDPCSLAITAGTNGKIDTIPWGWPCGHDPNHNDNVIKIADVNVLHTGYDGKLEIQMGQKLGDDEWIDYEYMGRTKNITPGNGRPWAISITYVDPNDPSDDWLQTDVISNGWDEIDLPSAPKRETHFVSKDCVGIDFVAVVCAHELMHQFLFYKVETDTDFDGVDDNYERDDDLGYKLYPDDDTYNIFEDIYEKKSKWANLNFDNEFLCFMEQDSGTADSNKDWSKGGKKWFRD